jgi:thioredoxin-related protein
MSCATSLKWEELNNGVLKAAKEDKKVLMYFYSSNCHYCDYMNDSLFTNKEVIKILKKSFVLIKFNMDKDSIIIIGEEKKKISTYEMALGLGIVSFPETFIITKRGLMIGKMIDSFNQKKFLLLLTYLSKNYYYIMGFEDYIKGFKN